MSESKQNTERQLTSERTRTYKKNITDGKVRISIEPEDRYDQNISIQQLTEGAETLKQEPKNTSSFLENIRTGGFNKIYNRTVTTLLDKKNQKEEVSFDTDTDEKLLESIIGIKGFLEKIFLFFMGFLPGITLLHLFLIFFGSSGNFNLYANSALRVNHIIKLCSIYACVGGIFRAINNKHYYLETVKNQSDDLADAKGRYSKAVLSAICFGLIYILLIYSHIFVSRFSNNWKSTKYFKENPNQITIFTGVNFGITIIAIFGWYLMVNSSDTNIAQDEMDDDDEEMF